MEGQQLKFVNLYWETEDLGVIEAVFDGGSSEPAIYAMARGERGVYETTIPAGDYSRVTFQQAEGEPIHEAAAYNLYGASDETHHTTGVDFTELLNNTFYYDVGENPSYWGTDPDYDSVEVMAASVNAASQKDYEVSANPGDMVYFIDMAEVENPGDPSLHSADRVHIAFLKDGHEETPNFDGEQGAVDGEVYTMYERRDGVFSAPFPETVGTYAEIAFQLVRDEEGGGETTTELIRHFNFRGQDHGESEPSKKRGKFKYNPQYTDAFFYNTSENDSFWNLHPSRADNSLDTQVLYVDNTDYTGNGIIGHINDLWIRWPGMKEGMISGEGNYDPEKGYRITNTLAQKNVRYFQFPYNCGATENTILTLTYTVGRKDGKPSDYDGKTYTFKFAFVTRSNTNCLNLDNIWEFNGQMWTHFEVGEIEKRTVFFRNKKTEYQEIWMRIGKDAEGAYATEEDLKGILTQVYPGWTEEDRNNHIAIIADTAWLKLDKVGEPNDYNKTELYSLDLPAEYAYIQFRGVKEKAAYYSNREEISTSFSYPCYYATQIGNPSQTVPETDVETSGITGFWRSVYSSDTSGDESQDIPEGTFVREEDAFYADITLYDYYSDFEMSGRKLAEAKQGSLDYVNQGDLFNEAAQKYYQTTLKNQGYTDEEMKAFHALYTAAGGKGSHSVDTAWNGNVPANIWTGDGQGPIQNLADANLTSDGRITTGGINGKAGVEMPFFNEDFLRGNNSLSTAVGNVYKNVLFPFKKDADKNSATYGYWMFNSASAQDAMRLSYDTDEGYFLNRTNEPIQYRNMNQFFPFTDQKTVGTGSIPDKDVRVNKLFGAQLNIDFALTDDKTVYNEFTEEYEPIRFEFQGDDDAWIYIDGVLALDMGGIHDAVRGEINFKEGTYTIWRALKTGNSYEGKGTVYQTGRLSEELMNKLKETGASHRLTMYYMERAMYESNLKLTFNFPRENTFSVEKQVDVKSKETNPKAKNIFQDLLENMSGFLFDIQNLVTSGSALAVEDSAGYLSPGEYEPVFIEGEGAKFEFADGNAGTIKQENGVVSVVQNAIVKGAKPEEETLLKVTPEGSKALNASEFSYLRLAMKNQGASDSSARNLYIALLDQSGKRAGGYVNTLGYEGESNSFVTGEETIIRIDYRKMDRDDGFDWSKVSSLLIGVRRTKETDSAAYDISSIAFFENMNQAPKSGFSVTDDQISDYGSYASGELTAVDGAWYVRKNQNADGSYDTGVSRQTDQGEFALGNKQKVVFTDKFRTGSYIALREKNVDENVFQTTWSIQEDGQEVEGKYLLNTRSDATTVINPYPMLTLQTPLKDVEGTTVYDKRQEVLSDEWLNSRPGGSDSFSQPDTETALVYRSYREPDTSANLPVNLNVSVKNVLKYGEITITKQLSEAMKNAETEKYPAGDYLFDIYYTDIAGMGLESQLTPVTGNLRYVQQTVTVHVDESGTGSITVPNIPAGTTYHITERPSNGTKLVGIEIGMCEALENGAKEDHKDVSIYGVKDGDYTEAYVEGTAYASNQHITFTNERRPFYMDIAKIWNDGLTDEEREELGITEVRIRLQRRPYQADQGEEDGWKNVTKDFFANYIGEEGKEYLVLKPENGWKTTSKIALPVEDENGTKTYEYRIQELDEDGKLRNYQVTYDEIRNPDYESGGEKFLYVTYRAANTPAGIVLTKLWEDNEDISGVRPKKIRVKLLGASDYDPEQPSTGTWKCYLGLLDPGHTCGEACYIELEEVSAWKQAVSNLPLRDEKDQPYYYKMAGEEIYYENQWIPAEDHLNGYKVTYGDPVLPQGAGALTISVTNSLSMGNIKLIKKDNETEAYLAGAKFQIERLIPQKDENGKDIPIEELEVDKTFDPWIETTNNLGEISFSSLAYGKYKITELEAPSGYLLLKQPVYITIDEKAFEQQAKEHQGDLEYDPQSKTIVVTVKNEKGLYVPGTGGRGILGYTMVGFGLCTAAALLYRYRLKSLRRTHHRRRK